MKILNIRGHDIKSDSIIGISDLQAISTGDCLCDWEWGIVVYCNFEINITFGYGGKDKKENAIKYRDMIVEAWKEAN